MNPPDDSAPSNLDEVLEAALDDRDAPRALAQDPRFLSARMALEVVDRLPRPEPTSQLRQELFRRISAEDARRTHGFFSRLREWLTTPVGGGLALAAAASIFAFFALPQSEPISDVALAKVERLELAENLDMYKNLEIIENLDVLEELELIESLPEESG